MSSVAQASPSLTDGPLSADCAPVVDVRGLSVSFVRGGETVRALRGVDLRLAPGEAVGLVGESGSGKSVLGLSLLGLLPDRPAPTITGEARVCGVDMVSAGPSERRWVRKVHLGAVFQDPMTSLNPTMRVGRQVEEAAGGRDEALSLLEQVGIPDAARRMRAYPHELSGGQRQRIMIAMAVAGSPSLIIADEPTTALDVTVQAQILRLLRRLCEDTRTALLMVTHDLGVATEVADRIAVLYAGRMAECGEAREVFTAPSHPYTIGLLRSRLTLASDRTRPVVTLAGEPPDPRRHPPGCPFAPRCAERLDVCDEVLPALTSAPRRAGRIQAACIRLDDVMVEESHIAAPPPWPQPAPGRAPTAVVVTGLAKRYGSARRGRLTALDGVNLEVLVGESLAVVGESGSGKSTLLRIMAGLDRPDEGSVGYARGQGPQMVFQDAGASLTPWLTVGELVGERVRHLKGDSRRTAVAEALKAVGLPEEVAGAKAVQLSGGQRQRAALARAIVVPPQVLLCDEPTSALDVSLAATVLNLIGRLRRQLDMAVVFVTHDLAAARLVADRVAVMNAGRIVELGPAEQVCSEPTDEYTRRLLGAFPASGFAAKEADDGRS